MKALFLHHPLGDIEGGLAWGLRFLNFNFQFEGSFA
jgi:hypothetical protein